MSVESLQLLRTVQTSDAERWSAINLRGTVEGLEEGDNTESAAGGSDLDSLHKREQSGINDLNEHCEEDDSADGITS